MSESRFLRYQDANGDGLIDICGPLAIVKEAEKCPTCFPNPSALLINWRKKTATEAYFNERACVYNAVVVTSERSLLTPNTPNTDTTAADTRMEELFDEYQETAIEAILLKFNKNTDSDVIENLKEVTVWESYELDPRPLSPVKLLYSIAHEHIAALENATAEQEATDDSETTGGTGASSTVTYMASTLKQHVTTVVKGFYLYSRYYKVWRAIDSGNLVFKSTGKVYDLDKYGALTIWGDSPIIYIFNSLDSWLDDRGHNLFDSIKDLFKRNVVKKLEITYTAKYKVEQIKVWTQECNEEPIIYKGKKIQLLNKMPGFKNPTAVAYFAKLDQMVNGLTAREPKPWMEFIIEHTYPEIDETFNFPINQSGEGVSLTEGSCIAAALASEGKQLGQDVLDEVFSLGDAVAFAFHKNQCAKTAKEVKEQREKIGVATNPNTGLQQNVFKLAQEQAFKRVQQNDASFISLCQKLELANNPSSYSIDDIWEMSFDRMKLCGLTTLMIDAIGCLFKGMTLEVSLSTILTSALNSMGVQNFGFLFKGLPPEVQVQLDATVKRKLNEQDIFKAGGANQQFSDTLAGPINFTKPWEVSQVVEDEQEKGLTVRPPPRERDYVKDDLSLRQRRTLLQQMDIGTSGAQQLSEDVILEAYTLALIEVYNDNLLELLNELNQFPGAQLVANFLAFLDCPKPPLFNPSVMDFIKDIELPICRNMREITLPRFVNPFGWWPSWSDWSKIAFDAALRAIQEIILEVLTKLLVKICEIIGTSACEILDTLEDLVRGKLEGGNTLRNILRESICGPDIDDDTIDNTFANLLSTLGTGAPALADANQATNFAQDVSAATTRKELFGLFMGNNEATALNIIDSIIDYGYPSFREGLSGKDDIASFFKDIGNLMPLQARSNIQDILDALPADDALPAIPALCATPAELQKFEDLRKDLLEDRATPEQIEELTQAAKNKNMGDLGELQRMLQQGIPETIMGAMPPMVTPPGPNCDQPKGLFPYEPEEAANVTVGGLTSAIELLKLEYSTDMIGAGGALWPSDKKWGMVNMILSDTQGKPYTEHQKWVRLKDYYVDFVIAPDDSFFPGEVRPRPPDPAEQKGQYPKSVASWLQTKLINTETEQTNWNSSNLEAPASITYKSIEDVNDVDLLAMPKLGYNVDMRVKWSSKNIEITKNARKKNSDLQLQFRDNGKGSGNPSYGFDLKLYLSDIINVNQNTSSPALYQNRFDDNIRIIINDVLNPLAPGAPSPTLGSFGQVSAGSQPTSLIEQKYEFLSVDNRTFEEFNFENYPQFLNAFQTKQDFLPQVLLLKEMIQNKNENVQLSSSVVKSSYDDLMTDINNTLGKAIGANNEAFSYGAYLDPLTPADAEYLTPEGTPYADSGYTNDDQILGISKNQDDMGENARIIYLDPAKYGGSYINPPVYVKPLRREGWLGVVDILYPELSPCKPTKTELIDFGEIEKYIRNTYEQIPEDSRLKSDPDCVTEIPYNRILDRSARAGIESIILTAIKIYASTHFIKSFATFTTFKPDFIINYSSIYAQYVVQFMEDSFKDGDGASWEFLEGPFKDDEFWYAFLEQSVQLYSRKVDNGTIEDPPSSIIAAITRLNDMQETYLYPRKPELKEAKDIGDEPWYSTLKGYREEKNFEAIKETEDDAKLVLKELVNEQLQSISDKFMENLKAINRVPRYNDVELLLLTEFTKGGIPPSTRSHADVLGLDLDKEITEEPDADLGNIGDEDIYTAGGLFVVAEDQDEGEYAKGDEYVGYYHVHEDEQGNPLFMAGEMHIEDAHDILRPVASKVSVPIGDIMEIGARNYGAQSSSRPFIIEKYIKIDGTKHTPTDAIGMLRANSDHQGINLAELYPGTLELVTDASGQVLGLSGEIGIRYGIQLSLEVDGVERLLVDTEIDALDMRMGDFAPFEGNSKLLLCLVNQLRNTDEYKLLVRYVFPFNKLTAAWAIYNDMAFLPSIGESTVNGTSFADAPGMKFSYKEYFQPVPGAEDPYVDSKDGWATASSRAPKGPRAAFTVEWDEWDKVLLRNSKSRIKKIFKTYYFSRKFKPGDPLTKEPAAHLTIDLLSQFRPHPGRFLFPWWKRKVVKTNPFDKNGNLCDKE